MWCLSKPEGGGSSSGGERGGVCVPQCSDFRGLKETRRWRGAWHRG